MKINRKFNQNDFNAILWSYIGCLVLTGGMIADLYFGMGKIGWLKVMWVSLSAFAVIFIKK